MISRDDFRPLWLRLINAMGRPANADLRLQGLYDETSYLSLPALRFAVDAWIRGSGEDTHTYGRFPFPSDLIKIADAYTRKTRASKPWSNPYREIHTLPDHELTAYMQTLERQHKLNYQYGQKNPHSHGLGWIAMDVLLKKSYATCITEWEKRHGKSNLPKLQEEPNVPLGEGPSGNLSVLLEELLDSAERDTDRDHGEQDRQVELFDSDRPGHDVQGGPVRDRHQAGDRTSVQPPT